MRLTDLSLPRCLIVDQGDSVHVVLGDGDDGILVSTAHEAHRLADELRKAALYLEERARLVAERKDREAGRATNKAFEKTNRSWPKGTLPSAFTGTSAVTEQKVVTFDDCPCTRSFVCDSHREGA